MLIIGGNFVYFMMTSKVGFFSEFLSSLKIRKLLCKIQKDFIAVGSILSQSCVANFVIVVDHLHI